MMEYLCLLYVQKFSLLTEALSAALFSVFRTLKEHAHVVSIIDSLRGILVIFVPLKNACARARARNCSRNSRPFFSPRIMSCRCGPCTPAPAFPCFDSFRAATHPFGRGSYATP